MLLKMKTRRAQKRLERNFLIGCVIFGLMYLLSTHLFTAHVAYESLDHRISKASFKSSRGSLGKQQFAVSNTETKTTANNDKANVTHGETQKRQARNKPIFDIKRARRTPSVDYFTCCGVGHRLSKLADAHYLSLKIRAGLRVFFGFCEKQEIYSYFFGPQPLEELEEVAGKSGYDLFLKVKNDAPGFSRLRREGPNATCQCQKERLEEDFKFYSGLRSRFRAKPRVDAFRESLFFNHTVIGMHIRAGNNETGDFLKKNRAITNHFQWAENMAEQLETLTSNWIEPPILFIATDTVSMVSTFRSLLKGKMEVLELQQTRPENGEGVFFGQKSSIANEGRICLDGWEDAFTDAMILSYADVLIAARPSSFTQSLPMTMVLSTPKEKRKVRESFCEVNPSATAMQCYEDLIEWCCQGNTSFSLETIQNYDYRRMPDPNALNPQMIINQMEVRPRADPNSAWEARECIPTPKYTQRKCLPYYMPDRDSVQEAGQMAGHWKSARRKGKTT